MKGEIKMNKEIDWDLFVGFGESITEEYEGF